MRLFGSGLRLLQLPLPSGESFGRWKPIIDLLVLNSYIIQMTFTIETAHSELQSVIGDFIILIDPQDAYFHISFHHNSKFLCFICQGEAFLLKGLCFGLVAAPYIFTRSY